MPVLFSIPKPFEGRIGEIQRKAVQSWRRFNPDWEIVLFADENGTAEVAKEFGAKHVAETSRNEFGTPLLHSVFAKIEELFPGEVFCYLNADISLFSCLTEVLRAIPYRCFLLTARRIEVREIPPLESLEKKPTGFVAGPQGVIGPPSAIDILLFPSAPEFFNIPPFAVGRPGWDNWFLYNALAHGHPVVDATATVRIVHPDHPYGHVPSSRGRWCGPEGDRNRELAGGWQNMFSILDASHELTPRGLRPTRSAQFVERRVDRLRVFRPVLFRCLAHWRLRYLYCYLVPRAGRPRRCESNPKSVHE
ncbi:MAG: hypothetical protein N2255_08635 [Kiritimatiellae bacterium]|nr:hypothetical protein [Kiritimatiellia bacterium]